MDISQSQIVSFIWSIADDCLRDVFQRGRYRDVILPMVILRRFDALLEPTKEEVNKEIEEQREVYKLVDLDEKIIQEITKQPFYNTSKWTLKSILSNATNSTDINYDNFVEYLNGYSDNVKDILQNFDYYNIAKTLNDNHRLLSVIEKITDPRINLTDQPTTDPDGLPLPPLSNIAMGTIFEELLRRFNEENNEETGAHFTPRDAIRLLAHLIFDPIKDKLPKTISLYDPAEGSGGMLTEGYNYLIDLGVTPSRIELFGTEINQETYAICKADLLIKGVSTKGMHHGNTLTEDHFKGQNFGYCITNPPYGKSWKTDKEEIYSKPQVLQRYELPLRSFSGEIETIDCTPRTSDGQLLFMLEEINKMKPLNRQPEGSRIASIHNGSSLFTGDAGQGESNIRRYIIENDLVDCIIQLPNNIFYNTGIATYVWILTNKKANNRKGYVQLIDASHAYEKLRKNQGSRNCTITPHHTEQIVQTYINFKDQTATQDNPIESKIFHGDDFRYYSVTIERPLCLRCQFSADKINSLLLDNSDPELSQYLYQTYKEKLFQGLDDNDINNIKNYLQEQEITKTKKQLDSLTDPNKWQTRQTLMRSANTLMSIIGTDQYTDYNIFYDKVLTAVKTKKLKLTTAQVKNICRAMSCIDPEAKPVIAKRLKKDSSEIKLLTSLYHISTNHLADYGIYKQGTEYLIYESDSNLRDTEKIPIREDIYDYFLREVRPYAKDAWINVPETKIGCEISFNKYFYHPQPLRSLDENEQDIRRLYSESKDFIDSILNLQ